MSSVEITKSAQPLTSSTPPPVPPSSPMATMFADAMDMEMDNRDELSEQLEAVATSPLYTEFFSRASKVFGQGETFMDLFDKDEHAEQRTVNLYYPFASQPEWELASYLLNSGLSMAVTVQFLKLQLVSLTFPI